MGIAMTDNANNKVRYAISVVGIALAYVVVYAIAPEASRTKALGILTLVVVLAAAGGFGAARMAKRSRSDQDRK